MSLTFITLAGVWCASLLQPPPSVRFKARSWRTENVLQWWQNPLWRWDPWGPWDPVSHVMQSLNWIFHQTDLQRQLQQSQRDADRLQQQLQEKDAMLRQLQQDLEERTTQNSQLQEGYDRMFNSLQTLIHAISPFIQYNRGKVVAVLVIIDKLFKAWSFLFQC